MKEELGHKCNVDYKVSFLRSESKFLFVYFSDTDRGTWMQFVPALGVTFYSDLKYSSCVETGFYFLSLYD